MQRKTRRSSRTTALILLLLILAIAAYYFLGPKPPPPPLVVTVTPQHLATATSHINHMRQALELGALAEPVSVTQKNNQHPISLKLKESDINTYLSGDNKVKAMLKAKGIQAVSVQMLPPNQIEFHAAAVFHGVHGTALVTAQLTPNSQTGVGINVVDARFGRLPPPLVKAAAQQIAQHFLQTLAKKPTVTITKILVTPATLSLEGYKAK